jgi:hypothetical protein
MKKSSLEKAVESGVSFLSKVFPLKSYLYFPLLNATLFWALKRAKEWKREIFSWKVWLDPDRIEAKPDDFILDFFKSYSALHKVYASELSERDMVTLRQAFSRLYPILGLEDPFLSSLFLEELESKDYRTIVRDFEKIVGQAKNDIDACSDSSRLIRGLKTFADEMLSLNLDLISQDEVQTALADIVKRRVAEKDE